MKATYDWITFKVFSPRQEWSHLLKNIDDFLNDKSIKPLIAMRVIEFNQLNENIQLSVLPQSDKKLSVTTLLQTFLKEHTHRIGEAGYAKTGCQNVAVQAIRALLSDIIIMAFRYKPVNNVNTFTLALYLHLALLTNKNIAIDTMQTFAGNLPSDNTDPVLAALEAEYAENIEVFTAMKNHLKDNSHRSLPPWITMWIRQYEVIVSEISSQPLLLMYRRTLYQLIKQLHLTEEWGIRLEYFSWKIMASELPGMN